MSTTIRTTGLATVCSHVASRLPASRRGALDEDHQINVGFNGLKKLDEEGHETFQTVAREVAKLQGYESSISRSRLLRVRRARG